MQNYRFFKLFLSILFLSACTKTPPPAPIPPLPDRNQIEWQKMETYAFVHFGLNTFNDLEWGFGNTPAATFNPTELDCDQWAKIIREAGLKGVMLTAKHHDGFCLWPSQYTAYSVKNSPWKNGKGDVVKELSEACKKYGLKFGIYLSPWDRNHPQYGKPEYVTYFHNQMRELLSNYGELFEYWFDGANGGSGWYGGANEKRTIDARTYYRYEDARKLIRELQPHAVIFGGTCPDIRWIGNEEGKAGETNWAPCSREDGSYAAHGDPEGYRWLPGECDVSIRPGWFYHPREDHQVRSLSHLVDLYYKSVGRNANLLLNFPIALNGKIHPLDSARVMEWKKVIEADFRNNLLQRAQVTADNYRGNSSAYSPDLSTDDNWDSYWATDDDRTTALLTFSFPEKQALNRLLLQEYIPLGQRVRSFRIEYLDQEKWFPVETADTLTTIGYKRIIRFKTVETKKVRIHFTRSKGPLCINNVEAYLAPPLLEEPVITRNGNNQVQIRTADPTFEIYYTTDGRTPQTGDEKYVPGHPFAYNRKGVIKAIAVDALTRRQSPVSTQYFDIPRDGFLLINISSLSGGDSRLAAQIRKESSAMFDGNAYTAFYLPAKTVQEISLDLGQTYTLSGFTYTPDQNRWGGGVITHYEFYAGNRLISSGEFSNIRNNPIEQVIRFLPVKTRQIRFVATQIADGPKAGIGEFSVLTE